MCVFEADIDRFAEWHRSSDFGASSNNAVFDNDVTALESHASDFGFIVENATDEFQPLQDRSVKDQIGVADVIATGRENLRRDIPGWRGDVGHV